MDHRQVKRLADEMRRHGFAELDLTFDGTRLRLVTDPAGAAKAAPGASDAAPDGRRSSRDSHPGNGIDPSPSQAPAASAKGAPETPTLTVVRAERVGIFTTGRGFDASVAEQPVQRGQIIGTIKGLNVQESIAAPVTGTIDRFLVADGQLVDFGQPLVEIDPGT